MQKGTGIMANIEYKVIPFLASIDPKKISSTVVAKQLEEVIKQNASEGWSYLRLESVSTFVQPDSGCFGFGGKPGYTTSMQIIVFSR